MLLTVIIENQFTWRDAGPCSIDILTRRNGISGQGIERVTGVRHRIINAKKINWWMYVSIRYGDWGTTHAVGLSQVGVWRMKSAQLEHTITSTCVYWNI